MDSRPLIGVATTVKPRTGLSGAGSTPFFRRMALHARGQGVRLALFDPEDVHFHTHSVNGFILVKSADGTDLWERRVLALPDAIYENVFVHLVMKGAARSLRDGATERGIPLFNPLVPGKATLTQWVSIHPELGMRTPVTERVRQTETILRMLERYGTVYVKPSGGYGGRGVLRVRRAGGGYRVDSDRFRERGSLRTTLSPSDFERFIGRVALARSHVVQQRIPLLELDGGQVDFRVVVQRGRSGDWTVVGIVPKVAAKDGVVTNLVAGGRRMSLAEIGRRFDGRVPLAADLAVSAKNLERAALREAQFLTRRYPTLGIVGYDLGLDRDGNIWFIELNPKPARRLLFPDMQQRAGDLAVDFACYLAERARG